MLSMQNSEVHCYASSCCYNPRVHLYPKWCGIASLMMVMVMMMRIRMGMRRRMVICIPISIVFLYD